MFLPSYNLISVEQLADTTTGIWASTFPPPATSISFLSHSFIHAAIFTFTSNLHLQNSVITAGDVPMPRTRTVQVLASHLFNRCFNLFRHMQELYHIQLK